MSPSVCGPSVSGGAGLSPTSHESTELYLACLQASPVALSVVTDLPQLIFWHSSSLLGLDSYLNPPAAFAEVLTL